MKSLKQLPRSASKPPADLGRTAARGLLWMMTQTVGVKLVSLIANVMIAWFVLPGDAGLVGMSYTVLALAGFVQYIGMQDVLVQRHAHFRRWINPAFWMSLTIGLLGGALVAAAAPFAAMFYDEPRLIGMVLLLAIASPLQTISMVPQALLSMQLRFRMIVAIGAAAAVGASVLSVLLAWMGFGAYSFVIPVPIVALLQSAVLWWAARPRIRWSPQLNRWKYLVRDIAFNGGICISLIVINGADHVILGRMFSRDVLGIYYWAVNLSTQLQRLLVTNLVSVLLPSLSKLQHDPQRQGQAFIQATRVLAMIGIPLCLLQAAVAQPLVRILYKQAWEGVGPVLAVLSIGMAFNFVSGPATSMLKAQGRFRAAFLIYAVHAIFTVAVVWIAAILADEHDAAMRVAVAFAFGLGAFGPFYLYLALRKTGHGWRAVGRVFATPTLASAIAIGAGLAAARLVPQVTGRDFLHVAVVVLVTGVMYPALIGWLDRETWQMAMNRVRSLRHQSSPESDSDVSA